jgi:citrate lyase gamma subunit
MRQAINEKKVRQLLKPFQVSEEFLNVLDNETLRNVVKAKTRASNNHRKTIMVWDL